MKVSIIIPCFNEENTIKSILDKISKINQFEKQIIVIDDCSTDNSLEEIEKIKHVFKDIIIIKHDRNLGKGAAIKSSKNYINGDAVIIQDADLEYDPNDIDKLIQPIKNNFENIHNFSHWFRIVGNVFLTKLSNLINNQNLTDAHTCYKVFSAGVFENIILEENNFNFCPEITTKISNQKIKIKELPISYNGRDYKEGKKIKTMDGIKAIATLFRYKFKK